MEREARNVEYLKQKLIEIIKITNELRRDFGVDILPYEIPKEWSEDSIISKFDGSEVVNWWVVYKEDHYVVGGGTPVKYFEKDIKEIKLMLLKEIQDSYRKGDEEIKDNIERLKVRIKELTASRKSKIGKWFKVKQLIEELQ